MELSAKQVKLGVVLVVLIVVGVAYVIWSHMPTSAPMEIPGQTVLNPTGAGMPSAKAGGQAGVTPRPVFTPGKPDPVYGPGPSSSAPLPGSHYR